MVQRFLTLIFHVAIQIINVGRARGKTSITYESQSNVTNAILQKKENLIKDKDSIASNLSKRV